MRAGTVRRYSSLHAYALLACVTASVGIACSTSVVEDPEADGLRLGERKIVGEAKAYPADLSLRARDSELRGSMAKRRQVAWDAVARVLQPVKGTAIAKTSTGAVEKKSIELPAFRTWYGRDDYERLFGKLYGEMGGTRRRARTPFSAAEIAAAIKWNATSGGSWAEEDYLARIRKLTDAASVQGLGGNGRVSYSPGYVTHFLNNYSAVYNCIPKLPSITETTPPPSPTNFSQCYNAEFPADAAVMKASWWRVGPDLGLPVVDTSAAALKAKLAGTSAKGAWDIDSRPQQKPDASKVYTVKMTDGTSWRLPGIHFITKELRDWMWITLWWSPNPNEDFGADRPDKIKALGGPWANYKMCVVTAYDEGDADPRGGFAGTLGDSLAATHAGVGGPTWCSNPFIEKGDNNAQTNCIGCHQHAGDTKVNLQDIISNNAKHPFSGRTKERQSFPTDYSWSFDHSPEAFAMSIQAQIQNYDASDPQ